MSSTFKIYQKYYVELVRCLPMDDVIFIGELFKNELLPSDLKAKLKSLSTSKEKAAKFLDDVIEPALNAENSNGEMYFTLLSVMKESEYDTVKKLAEAIISELDHRSVSTVYGIDNALQWFSDYLKERYIDNGLTKLNEENDPWPPVKINCFTTPLFIHQKQMRTKTVTKKVIAKRMVGNIQSIPKVSESNVLQNIEEIFEPIECKSILIEAHPGVGKTMLVKEICLRWAKGKLLNSSQLVLLLLLRDPKVQEISNEQQMIEYFLTPSSTSSRVKLIHQHLEEKHGTDVTLILDGLDELEDVKLNQDSFFTRLVNKQILNKARLVITSCPLMSACLHEKVDKCIEILGFGMTGIDHFINETLKNYPDKLQKLHKHFQLYPNIYAVCYHPLIMTITVFLCMQEDLSSSTAKMYIKFVMHMICRYLKRKGMMKPDEKVSSMDDFQKPVCDVLKLLELVAYNGVLKNKKVFEEQDLPDYEMWKNNPTCFGLLQPTKCYSAQDIGSPVLIFNFYHEQLQKYFAARHVMSLPEHQAYELIRKYLFINQNHLDSDSSEDESDITIISNQKDIDDNLDDNHGSDDDNDNDNNENDYDGDKNDDNNDDDNKDSNDDADNDDDDNKDSNGDKDNDGTFTITIDAEDIDDDDIKLTMDVRRFADMLTTIYSNDSDVSDSEDSDDVSIYLSDMWLFLFGISNGNFTPLWHYLSTYSLDDNNDIDARSQDFIPPPPKKFCASDDIQTCPTIDSGASSRLQHDIDTISQDILDDHAKVMFLFQCFREAKQNQLCKDLLERIYEQRNINLENQVLNSCHIASLGLFLSKSKYKWESVNLVNCNIRDKGIRQLFQYFFVRTSDKSTVGEINLSRNYLSHSVSSALAKVISYLQPHTLRVCNNYLAIKGIASIMAEISMVKQLHIENNYITDLEKEVVFKMLTSLTELYIGKNPMGDKGAELLSEGLSNTASLQILNVHDCEISGKGAKSLANALTKNKSLWVLDLSSNSIGDDGAIAIADALAHNSTLAGLRVPRNNISSSGVKALKDMMKTKTTLFKFVISNKEKQS